MPRQSRDNILRLLLSWFWDVCAVGWLHACKKFNISILGGWGRAVSRLGEEGGREF